MSRKYGTKQHTSVELSCKPMSRIWCGNIGTFLSCCNFRVGVFCQFSVYSDLSFHDAVDYYYCWLLFDAELSYVTPMEKDLLMCRIDLTYTQLTETQTSTTNFTTVQT